MKTILFDNLVDPCSSENITIDEDPEYLTYLDKVIDYFKEKFRKKEDVH